jgi:hypothetical protein
VIDKESWQLPTPALDKTHAIGRPSTLQLAPSYSCLYLYIYIFSSSYKRPMQAENRSPLQCNSASSPYAMSKFGSDLRSLPRLERLDPQREINLGPINFNLYQHTQYTLQQKQLPPQRQSTPPSLPSIAQLHGYVFFQYLMFLGAREPNRATNINLGLCLNLPISMCFGNK